MSVVDRSLSACRSCLPANVHVNVVRVVQVPPLSRIELLTLESDSIPTSQFECRIFVSPLRSSRKRKHVIDEDDDASNSVPSTTTMDSSMPSPPQPGTPRLNWLVKPPLSLVLTERQQSDAEIDTIWEEFEVSRAYKSKQAARDGLAFAKCLAALDDEADAAANAINKALVV